MRPVPLSSIGWVLLVLVLGAVAGCGEQEAAKGPDTLVVVNGVPVTMKDLEVAWNRLPEEQRKNYAGTKGVKQLLNELVTWKLMAQEAERRGLDTDPDLKRRLDLFRQQQLVNALLDRSVTDADIYKFFQEQFALCRFILIKFPENPTDQDKAAAKTKADEVYALITPEADFGELAKKYSQAENAAEGGATGYITHQVVTTMAGLKVAEGLFSLKNPFEFTAPLEGNNGYYIVQMLEPPGKLNPEGLSPKLKQALRDLKKDEAIRSFDNELNTRAGQKIDWNQDAVQKLQETIGKQIEDQKMLEGETAEGDTTEGDTATAPAPGATAAAKPGATGVTPPGGPTTTKPGSTATDKPEKSPDPVKPAAPTPSKNDAKEKP